MGLYLHVPFCNGKCPYCDFYSITGSEDCKEEYAKALCQTLARWGREELRQVDTVYFGGGTPALLGTRRLCAVLEAVYRSFHLARGAEVTLEANPLAAPAADWLQLTQSGFNRLSVGLQSANDEELALLGRRHTAAQAARAVELARRGGFSNLSLDVMLATPGQTEKSLEKTLSFCAGLGAAHVSAYLLKIEDGTPFAQDPPPLPGEDQQSALYLLACQQLEEAGYRQYEISNFSKPGWESRHNLRYWRGLEYLGLGPAAHSLYQGRRFYYPRSIEAFLKGAPPLEDGAGGGEEEYLMLRLRLTEGVHRREWEERFGTPLPAPLEKKARQLQQAGFTLCSPEGFRLTRQGFLVSNEIICQLLLAWETDTGEME